MEEQKAKRGSPKGVPKEGFAIKNELVVRNAILDLHEKNNLFPNFSQIAEYTGLDIATVSKYCKLIYEEARSESRAQLMQQYNETVLSVMLKKAQAGDVKAARLYFDVIDRVMPAPVQESNTTLPPLEVALHEQDKDKTEDAPADATN